MRAVSLTKSLATAASATAVSTAQTLGAAGNFAIDGVHASGGVATLDTQRRLLLTFAADETGHNFTIIGTNDGVSAIKAIVAGTTAGTLAVALDFKTVTQFSSDSATTGNVSLGTNGVGSTPWVIFADTINFPELFLEASVSGTVNYSVEYTADDFLTPIPSPLASTPAIQYAPATVIPNAIAFPAMATQIGASEGSINFTIHAWRLTVNSGTGVAKCTGRQSGLASP